MSPQGNPYKEKCNCCSALMQKYHLVEAKLVKFTTADDTIYYKLASQPGYSGEYVGTYCASIHPEGSTDYSQIQARKTVFLTEEVCKNYCKYMNKDSVLNTIPPTSRTVTRGV